jgi:hypothetical protein
MPSPSHYGCSDYRVEMLLASLQARLRNEDLTEDERRRLEEELQALEDDFYR